MGSTDSAAAARIVSVTGGGWDIFSDEDAFHYYYTEHSGDFDVSVHVLAVEDTDPWAKGGIMVRESLEADAKNVMARIRPDGVSSIQWRPETGGSTASAGGVSADWLRLTREGDVITLSISTDGEEWTQHQQLTGDDVKLSEEVYLGLPATSHDEGTLATVQYTDISGVSPSTNRDVGPVQLSGDVSAETGVPVVSTGSATDVAATSATLNGSLDDYGDLSSAEVYFQYRESSSSSWTETERWALESAGSFNYELTDLSAYPREYAFRAILEGDGETYTGATRPFSTPSIVQVTEVSEINPTSAMLKGHLADLAGADSADVTLEYREITEDEWTASDTYTMTEIGSFEYEVTGLTSRRLYEVHAIVDAGDRSVTSSTLSFSTPSRSNGEPPGDGGPPSESQFDIEDGFADPAPWLDDDTPVITISEPTREAMEAALHVDHERLIVFETSGSIDLGGESLGVNHGKFYIAGQTAPPPGITLVRGGLFINADDCVVQHIRVRRGDDTPVSNSGDAIGTGDGAQNVVFDHCTATWGTDEALSLADGAENATISNCLIAEALRNSAFHEGGNGHSAGSLIGAGYENVALLGNLWASNLTRNPRLQSGSSVVVNNVSYDYRNAVGCSSETVSSIVGNAFIRGDVSGANVYGDHDGEIFVDDNYSVPEMTMVSDSIDLVDSPPKWPEGLEELPSDEVKAHVLRNVGARPADRTYHDRRILRNVANWEPVGGHQPGPSGLDHAWIDHQEIIGGYPEIPINTHSVTIPQSGTWTWLRLRAKRVESGLDETYADEANPGIIDDFEDANLDEYVGGTREGGSFDVTNHYEVTAESPVASGNFSLKNTSGSDMMISSHVDLPRYPRSGDTFTAAVAGTETTPTMGIAFGVKSHENCYYVRHWSDTETLQFYRITETEWSTPEHTLLAESDPVSIKLGEIYEFVVDWGVDGDISIDLTDADGETIAAVSATDSTHLYGGFGTRRTGMLDDIRIDSDVAYIDATTTEAIVGDRIEFEAGDGTGNDSWINSLEWDFGDGTSTTGWWNAHRYETPGTYVVGLTATDNTGRETTHELTIQVSDLDGDLARIEPSATAVDTDERIAFHVEDVSDDDRWIESLDWEFGDGTTATGWFSEHRYASAGTYTVTLTITDNTGHSTSDEVTIEVS